MAEHLKAIHTYSDPGLDKQNIFNLELSIRMHADGLSYCVQDQHTGRFLHIEAFDLSGPDRKVYIPGEEEDARIDKLSELLQHELNWLCQPFAATRILYEQGKSTLVPEALFAEEDKKDIFDFNVANGRAPEEEIRYDRIRSVNAYNLFRLPADVQALLTRHFQDATIFHHSTALITALMQQYRNTDTGKSLFVNTAMHHIDIMRIKDKKLDYFNSFRYNTTEDFMYYLVFVVEQLGLNPESVDMLLMGEVEKQSPLVDMIRKYIRNVHYTGRNTDFSYSFVFDQLPGHYYYNLLNASLCGS
jgi:hypothetical protein